MNLDLDSFRACNGEIIKIDCTREQCDNKLLAEFLQALQCLSARSRQYLWNDPKCPVRAQEQRDVEDKLAALSAAKLMFHDVARLTTPMLLASTANKRGDVEAAHKSLLKALNVKEMSNTLLFKGVVPFLNLPLEVDACKKDGEQSWMKVAVLQLLLELAADRSNPLIISTKPGSLNIKSADPASISLRLTNLLSASGLDISVEQRKQICDSCVVASGVKGGSKQAKQACVACYALTVQSLGLNSKSPEVVKGEDLRNTLLKINVANNGDRTVDEALAHEAFKAVQNSDGEYFTKTDKNVEESLARIFEKIDAVR